MASPLLKGTAFITGAASGIGKHTALAFARHGIQRLALADVNTVSLATSVKSLRDQYPQVEVLPLQLNVRNTTEVQSGIAETVSFGRGRLDVAVNNAGIPGSGLPTHEVTEEEWDRVLDIDLHGVWRCQKEELRVMMGQEDRGPRDGRGRIVNMASLYGLIGLEPSLAETAYVAAKHGVVGLTKADGNMYGQHGIFINAICPGYVETPLMRGGTENQSTRGHDVMRNARKRVASPDEIADSITFLASPMSSYMQSAALVVDGGFSTY